MEWNKIYYIDCMDKAEGLPSLHDNSIDLCLTDPPYEIFNIEWIEEILRICKGLIFTPGKKHYFDYIRYKKPNYNSKYWYKVNTQGTDLIEPFLCYGTIKGISNLRSVFEFPFRQPWKRKNKHPYPKNASMWYHILFKLKPESVIDPFIGSGTTSINCAKLGIPWIGYEIEPKYKEDVNSRFNEGFSCIKSPRNVNYWFKK